MFLNKDSLNYFRLNGVQLQAFSLYLTSILQFSYDVWLKVFQENTRYLDVSNKNQQNLTLRQMFDILQLISKKESVLIYYLSSKLFYKVRILFQTAIYKIRQFQKIYKKQSCIWSFGCTVLEMATGKKPWHEHNFDNALSALLYIITDNALPHIPEDLDQDLQQFIKICLQRDHKQRPTAMHLLQHQFIINQ